MFEVSSLLTIEKHVTHMLRSTNLCGPKLSTIINAVNNPGEQFIGHSGGVEISHIGTDWEGITHVVVNHI